jgi:hypothetical protein
VTAHILHREPETGMKYTQGKKEKVAQIPCQACRDSFIHSYSLSHSLSLSFSSPPLIKKFESTNMKISTVEIKQLSFFMLFENICWKNKWSWAATFVTKSLEIPLLHFESS